MVQLPILVTEPYLVFCVVTGIHLQLEHNNIKISWKPIIGSVICCYSPGMHALTVMVISHKLCFRGDISPEISKQGLQHRCIYASLTYPLHSNALLFSRFTDLYCTETGLMTWSMNMLLSRKYIHHLSVFIRIIIE